MEGLGILFSKLTLKETLYFKKNMKYYTVPLSFRSFGSIKKLQETKRKYITLKIQLRIPADIHDQKKQLAEILGIAPKTRFAERFLNRFVFEIPTPYDEIKVHNIFDFLEERYESLGIIQYSISNNTLGNYLF